MLGFKFWKSTCTYTVYKIINKLMTVKFIIYILYFNELISNMFFFSVVSTTCQDEGEPQGPTYIF